MKKLNTHLTVKGGFGLTTSIEYILRDRGCAGKVKNRLAKRISCKRLISSQQSNSNDTDLTQVRTR